MLLAELSKPELALVECLRVFARRGRLLRQKQAQENQIAHPENIQNTGPAKEQMNATQICRLDKP
jgi:hypothetical protein